MSRKSILNDLIAETEADLSLAKSVSAVSKKARFFGDQLECLRKIQKSMDGPLIFKISDLKKHVDQKSLGVLETRWNKVLDRRQLARQKAEEEEERKLHASIMERERIRNTAIQEHEKLVENMRKEKEKSKGGRSASGFTDSLVDDYRISVPAPAPVDLTDNTPPPVPPAAPLPAQVPSTSSDSGMIIPASTYIPPKGTAPYELLVAMASLPNPTSKDQVLKITGPGKAWGGLQKLKSEGFVTAGRLHSIYTYSLTPIGSEIASKLRQLSGQDKRKADLLKDDLEKQKRHKTTTRDEIQSSLKKAALLAKSTKPTKEADMDHVVRISDGATQAAAEIRQAGVIPLATDILEVSWDPTSYEIVLVVDQRENNRQEAQQAISGLGQKNVTVVTSVLYLGDFLFAARHKTSKKLAVLNTIIERKRYDDLNSSIVDSRYEEQKCRLRKCGVENVIYLIEDFSMSRVNAQIRDKAMASILGRMVAIDGFLLKKTKNVADSCEYMAGLYESIKSLFSGVTLKIGPKEISGFSESPSPTFSTMMMAAWQDKNLKSNHSLKVLFIQMLMTISGISSEKAEVIQRLFPTPRHLIEKYRSLDDGLGKTYLENATKGEVKSIGNAASAMVWEVFGEL
ncbi:Crossover junction endonuclease MUS81 [Yarrowia sp. C11]|nr:Crossover junction endonuclease MUS81 [Yarrowia sp. E02]KAG5371713.1 Crossover junction endonuclease MUS81 [Yarrowia sp. C11]